MYFEFMIVSLRINRGTGKVQTELSPDASGGRGFPLLCPHYDAIRRGLVASHRGPLQRSPLQGLSVASNCAFSSTFVALPSGRGSERYVYRAATGRERRTLRLD